MTSQKLLILMGILIIALTIAYILLNSHIAKSKGKVTQSNSKRSLKGVYFLYRIFSQTPILKRYYNKLKTNLETNYPADDLSIRRKATTDLAKCLGIIIAIIVLTIWMADGDYFFICMGLFMTYFVFTYLLSTAQQKLEDKLLNQLGDFITNIRHYYTSTGSIEDAIYDTLDETPYEMELHATKIYRIITSTNMEAEVDKYKDAAPNRFILTLVAICATIKEYGDKTLENGQSLFLTNINYLKEEINVEMIRKKKNNFLFSGLIALTILPLFFIKLIEAWGVSNIPEMESFYTGTAGTVVMAGIFITTVIVYQLVANLKDGHSDDEREHKFIDKLLSISIINKLITAEINRNYTKHLRIDDGLKMVGDRIGIKGFLMKRILIGLFALLMVNAVIFTSEWRAKQNILNDFTETFSSSIVPNEEYRETMREAAIEYTMVCRNMKYTEENVSRVQAEIEQRGLSPKFASEVATEVFARAAQYQDIYYKWWFMLINVAAYCFGFYIPYFILIYKLQIVKMSMEDEVIQFQTIVLILMHVDGIMVDTVLEWMERFAFCFKTSIEECIINLEYSVQKSLQKMKNQETFPPFRRFVDNLMMVDDEDILTAFSEIETDREYYKEKRKTDNEIMITQKAEIGKFIAFIPLFATLILYLIIPFGIYAVKMMGAIGM